MNTGSIQKVETNPFTRADLEHLLAMVDDDMKLEALPQTNHIKTIVSAELPMDLERKGQQSYQGNLSVRFMVFGNGTMKSLYDRSDGFFRRQIILTVRDKDKNREDDPFLAEKLCLEKEGIFLWALEGLRQLIQNNYHFTISERTKANMDSATQLNRLEQRLRELLTSMNPMNAKRVREEILKILDDYIPGVAELMTKTKALKMAEKELRGEIAMLKKEANSSKPSVQRLLELEKKVQELDDLHRTVDSLRKAIAAIPEDMIAQYRTAEKEADACSHQR